MEKACRRGISQSGGGGGGSFVGVVCVVFWVLVAVPSVSVSKKNNKLKICLNFLS